MSDVKVVIDGTEYPVQRSLTVTVEGIDNPAPSVGGITSADVPSATNEVGDEQPAKRAIESFPLDNGTVNEGQVLPAGHPAVLRHPELFVDVVVEDDLPDGQAITDLGSGTVTPLADTPANPAPAPEPGFDGDPGNMAPIGAGEPAPSDGTPTPGTPSIDNPVPASDPTLAEAATVDAESEPQPSDATPADAAPADTATPADDRPKPGPGE